MKIVKICNDYDINTIERPHTARNDEYEIDKSNNVYTK